MDVARRLAQGRTELAGWLLLVAIGLSVMHGLATGLPPTAPGAAFWIAGLLLFAQVNGLQRAQTLVMLLVGAIGLGYAWSQGHSPEWDKALATNQAMLAMLAGVTFLRLISLPETLAGEADPSGVDGLFAVVDGAELLRLGQMICLRMARHLARRSAMGASRPWPFGS